MLIDNTGGYLFRVLEWARKHDADLIQAACLTDRNGETYEAEVGKLLLPKLVAQLTYLDGYNTTIHPCDEGKHEPAMPEDVAKNPSLKLGQCKRDRVDPHNCHVWITEARDLGEHGFNVNWWFRKKGGTEAEQEKRSYCQHNYQPHFKCECFNHFMNGGLCFSTYSQDWSVHT